MPVSGDILDHRSMESSSLEFATVAENSGKSSDCTEVDLRDSGGENEAVVSRVVKFSDVRNIQSGCA